MNNKSYYDDLINYINNIEVERYKDSRQDISTDIITDVDVMISFVVSNNIYSDQHVSHNNGHIEFYDMLMHNDYIDTYQKMPPFIYRSSKIFELLALCKFPKVRIKRFKNVKFYRYNNISKYIYINIFYSHILYTRNTKSVIMVSKS